MGKTYYIYSHVEGSDITILLLNKFPRFCSHMVIYIISKSLLKNVNNIYIYIYISPNLTINEHKNYINASTLINKAHRSGLRSQQGNIMEHAVPCSLIKGRPF